MASDLKDYLQRLLATKDIGAIPPGRDVIEHHHLQALSTPTPAAQAPTPILAVLACQNEVPARQPLRQAVAFDYFERAAGRKTRKEAPPPKRPRHHAALLRTPSAGKPSNGSQSALRFGSVQRESDG